MGGRETAIVIVIVGTIVWALSLQLFAADMLLETRFGKALDRMFARIARALEWVWNRRK